MQILEVLLQRLSEIGGISRMQPAKRSGGCARGGSLGRGTREALRPQQIGPILARQGIHRIEHRQIDDRLLALTER
jgi:hypothetical protein